MKFIKPTAVLALMLTLSACNVKTLDDLNNDISASVTAHQHINIAKGGLIYSESKAVMVPGAEILSPVSSTTIVMSRHDVPAGEHLIKRTGENDEYFCTKHKTHSDPITGREAPSCFRDINTDGTFDEIHIFGANSQEEYLTYGKKIDATPYREIQVENPDAYSIGLYFNGTKNGKLLIEHVLLDQQSQKAKTVGQYCFDEESWSVPLFIPVFPMSEDLLKHFDLEKTRSGMEIAVQSVSDTELKAEIVRGFPTWKIRGDWFAKELPVERSKSCDE